jgi:hypothetical protein
MLTPITTAAWSEYEELGYLKLGKIDPETLHNLQQRIDDIMLGRASVAYDRMLMQLDSATGAYEDAGEQSKGFKGATLDYRKIQDLEYDPLFLEYLQHPVFEDICRRIYGSAATVSVFRAMFMNKPANKGTFLPWHQDRWTSLDRDPQLTVWTAIDPATRENGCVQVIPKSHRYGLINPTHPSGFLSKAQSAAICTDDRIVHVELEAGEVVILHNYLLHASDVNRSSQSRRAFSVCYMDAATLEKGEPINYPVAFGKNALTVGSLEEAVIN